MDERRTIGIAACVHGGFSHRRSPPRARAGMCVASRRPALLARLKRSVIALQGIKPAYKLKKKYLNPIISPGGF